MLLSLYRQQELLSNMVRMLGGHEWSGDSGKEHWWLCDQIGLRLYMLPLTDVRTTLDRHRRKTR